MDIIDIAVRLGAALVVGGALGLNRDLHGKPTGLRTLSLVALGAALAVMAVTRSGDINAVSRVIQGTLTGIGFLGAGVIVRTVDGEHVHGLTTAAVTWLTACVGVVCAVAEWQVILIGVPLVFAVLHLGGPIEKAIHRRWGKPADDAGGPPSSTAGTRGS
jgi:putative Mg2+ transporter-C (MgtC) family protein